MSKVLEKIVHKQTLSFQEKNNLLYNSQYGFRNRHSCSDAVVELASEILKANENQLHCLFIS